MSDFKIIGNPDPVVGKEEFYSVNDFLPNVLPFQNSASNANNHFEQPVKWEVYVLENGRWRKTKENDKTGKKISYTFFQKSLDRKGIRILARRGDEIARLNIKSHPAENPKIDSIELLDKNGKKPEKSLSYGQTLKARVHCLHMEKRKINVTLWEDDADGGGHDKANTKNILQILPGIVKNGKADVNFLLRPSFAKTAKKSKDEGKVHEYYVTTDFNNGKIASNNVDVNDLEVPVAPYKRKIPVQQPAQPKTAVQKPVQEKANTSGSSAQVPKAKAEITNVHLTDTAGHKIQGAFKEKQIKVWIDSNGLIGKEIRLKLYDEDGISDDELFNDKFIIRSNIYSVVIPLNKIPRSKGGNYWGEGAEQEVYADVEVIQTKQTKPSKIVNVDATVFKPDPIEVTNKVAKVGSGSGNEGKNCGEKFCIKIGSPNSELIREINIRLAGFGGNVPTDKFTDRTEKMIKQFQRDYMKVPETGKVCGNVLKAIDEFQKKYPINFEEIKCKCGTCTGYGNGRNLDEYQNSSVLEPYRKYEYPGIHRSLVCAYRASIFYINRHKHLDYKTKWIDSGYRCHNHPIYLSTKTTNHCGKALDIHYNFISTGQRARTIQDVERIREKIFNKYLGAKWDWKPGQNDIFNLESTEKGAVSWVHVDVREFSQKYLKTEYFIKTLSQLDGKSIVQLAKDLGFKDTCNCLGGSKNNEQNKSTVSKYKWAHSEFGNLIANHESGNNYNKCNQTKGGLKVIDNVKVVDLTIKEIQDKQENRDVFAVGRYQLIPITLNDAITRLSLDINLKLNEEMQDKIFDEYLIKLKRPKIIAYLEKSGEVEDAMYDSAKEWASIGVEEGKRISDETVKKEGKTIIVKRYAKGGESYYAGDGLNEAHISPEQIKETLINSKNANK